MDTKVVPNAPSAGDKPEKYIRTFAGDMEMLKAGGTPDLTPLNTPQSGVSGDRPATQDGLAVHPAPSPNLSPLTPPPSPAKPRPEPSPLKTYSGDFSDRVKETHASTATVLAAEQDSARRASVPTPEPPRINLPVVAASALLVIAGAAGVYFAYTQYLAKPQPVVVALPEPTPIFVDEREMIAGAGADLIHAMGQSVNKPLAAGTVRLLSTVSTTTSVFAALALSAPEVLLRNINAKGSMAGVINIVGAQSPFFILSVASYSDTFAGMLAWEPVMPLYLTDLFPPSVAAPVPETATTTATTTKKSVASSTPALQVIPAIRFFDVTIANHDARAYRDPSGRVALVYGYWNSTTLVIARDTAAFAEILARLATARPL